jgi:hypothetical protein
MLNLENVTTPVEVIQWVHESTSIGGFEIFGNALLIFITAVILYATKDFTTERAFAGTMAVMIVPAWLLASIGIAHEIAPFIFFILFVISAFVLSAKKN